MNKVIVSLEVPSVSMKYELEVPQTVTVGELIRILGHSVEIVSENRYCSSGEELLCIRERNYVLDSAHLVKDYSLKNGEHLILF